MPLLQVAKLGEPILRQTSQLVNLSALNSPDGKIQLLIDNMIDTMREEGGVGLAAPQVFQSLHAAEPSTARPRWLLLPVA